MLLRFLRRKKKPEAEIPPERFGDSVVLSPTQVRALANAAIAEIHDDGDLPPHEGVLTTAGGMLEIAESDRLQMGAIDLGRNQVMLLVTEGARADPRLRSLRERAESKNLHIAGQRVVTTLTLQTLHGAVASTATVARTSIAKTTESPGALIFRDVIQQAETLGASDLHIENYGTHAILRHRVHSLMRRLDRKDYDAATMRLVVSSAYQSLLEEGTHSESVFNWQVPVNCKIPMVINGKQYNLRFQTIPGLKRHDTVIRLLPQETGDEKIPTLEELGYALSQVRLLTLANRKSSGVIIICGVTGSGKSTTLRVLMVHDKENRKNYSAEDPVEYGIPGVLQVSVQDGDFAAVLRVLLRADPDGIMVGEIRDAATAGLVRSAAETGHRIATTLHTPSAFGVYKRLSSPDLAIPRDVLTSEGFISAIGYQRLLPVICKRCRLHANEHLDPELLADLRRFLPDTSGVYLRGAGCRDCRGLGTTGVTVAAEIVAPDLEIRQLVEEGKYVAATLAWRRTRRSAFDDPDMTGKTALEHGLYKVSQGLIDPRDLEEAFEPLAGYEIVEAGGAE